MTTAPVVLGHYECEDCGHQQTTEIFDAEFTATEHHLALTGGSAGSLADYCQQCDGRVKWLGVEAFGVLYNVVDEDHTLEGVARA